MVVVRVVTQYCAHLDEELLAQFFLEPCRTLVVAAHYDVVAVVEQDGLLGGVVR